MDFLENKTQKKKNPIKKNIPSPVALTNGLNVNLNKTLNLVANFKNAKDNETCWMYHDYGISKTYNESTDSSKVKL